VSQHADAICVREIYILFPVSRKKNERGTVFIFFPHLLHEMQGGRSFSCINVKYVLIMTGKKKFWFRHPMTKRKSSMIEIFFTLQNNRKIIYYNSTNKIHTSKYKIYNYKSKHNKIIVLWCTICFTTTCFGPFL